jgi:hypothetical protein
MNYPICAFLSAANTAEMIIDLFNIIITAPQNNSEYPLIHSIESNQIFFLNVPAESTHQGIGNYEVIGLFAVNEIQNRALLQKKINDLKLKWC